jgi:hypothetical protein
MIHPTDTGVPYRPNLRDHPLRDLYRRRLSLPSNTMTPLLTDLYLAQGRPVVDGLPPDAVDTVTGIWAAWSLHHGAVGESQEESWQRFAAWAQRVQLLHWYQDEHLCRFCWVRGTPGMTELAMHTRQTEHEGIFALANGRGTYAVVFFTDGSSLHGCFTLFADGSYSLA